MTPNQISNPGYYLIRTFQAAFAALADHKSDAERQQISEFIAAHLRSSAPVLDPVPASEIIQPLGDGARYEIHVDCGMLRLYVVEPNHDAYLPLTAAEAEQLRRDLARVLASGGVK